MGTKKPEEDNRKPVTKTKPTEKKTPAAKKPAAKKATAKKPAARKTTAKKPAAKKGTGKPVERKVRTVAMKSETAKPEAAKDKKQTEVQKPRPVSPRNGQPLPIGKPFQAGEEAREKGRKGGIKSAEVKKQRKAFREELLEMLMITTRDEEGNERTQQEQVLAALIMEAKDGNVKAYESIRDTIGEKAMEQLTVQVVAPQFTNLDAAFDNLGGDEL